MWQWPDDVQQVTLPAGATRTDPTGWSQGVPLEVPVGTRALQLEFFAPAGHLVQLAELTGPGGAVVPAGWLTASDQPWLNRDGRERVRATAWHAAFLVPNAPEIAVVDGHWQARAFAFDYDPATEARAPTETALDVRVTYLRGATPARGQVDLNFCLTGARGLTAATAPTHPRIQAALATLAAAWQPAGVQVGTVRYLDLPTNQLAVRHDDGADAELAALLRQTAGQPPGIAVVLLESVELQTAHGLVPAAGYTAGLPQAVGGGGPRSGIVLALQYDAPDLLGVVLAHELGHALGLYHVAEAGDSGVSDRLDDTDAQSPNLMQAAPSPAVLTLTPQQAAVMRTGPWLRTE